jgi:hypothetical protein
MISLKRNKLALTFSIFFFAARAQAEPSTQFDIACKGSITTSTENGTRTSEESDLYHIDLINHQWCTDACQIIRTIVSVQPNILIIQKVNSSLSANGISLTMRSIVSFNRESKALEINTTMNKLNIKGEIPCSIKPFTPFPASANFS